MSHNDFDFEPIRGLPARLPPGETLLWQGAPDLRALALRTFHLREVAIYFGLLVAWRLATATLDGGTPQSIALAPLVLILLGAAAVAILILLAWLVAKTTVYSITSRRVLMRIGVALPITFNLPFQVLASASLKLYPDGTGSIPLALNGSNRLAYLVLWPHARPWRLKRAEPTLRFVPEAAAVAKILAHAVAAAAPATTQTTLQTPEMGLAAGQDSWPVASAAA